MTLSARSTCRSMLVLSGSSSNNGNHTSSVAVGQARNRLTQADHVSILLLLGFEDGKIKLIEVSYCLIDDVMLFFH